MLVEAFLGIDFCWKTELAEARRFPGALLVWSAGLLVVLAATAGCKRAGPSLEQSGKQDSPDGGNESSILSEPVAELETGLVSIKRREVDGAEMVAVAEGPFTRGTLQGEGEENERPQKRVRLSGFWIDKTEVTVAAYERCVAAKACSPASRGSSCNAGRRNKDDHPINCVRWDQADGYCRWAGARLPTEAEWEKAARGTDGRTYPWGNEPPSCAVVVWYDEVTGHGCGKHGTWSVGTRPGGQSPYGALDMSGNVWEWVADWYDGGYYAIAPDVDPRGPEKGQLRILRGGGWGHDGPTKMRSGGRFRFGPSNQTPSTGFRCAMSMTPP